MSMSSENKSHDSESIVESSLSEVSIDGEKKSKKKSPKEKNRNKSIDDLFNDSTWVSQHVGTISDDKLEYLRSKEFQKQEKPPPGTAVLKYLKKQKELIDKYREFDNGIFTGDLEEELKEKAKGKVLIWTSFVVNVCLTVGKCIALILSASISILASFLDSCLDLLSGSIVFIASRLQKQRVADHYRFPVGKRRLETLSVIVFSATMFTASGQVLIEAINTLLDIDALKLEVDYITIGILIGTILVKFTLFLICKNHEAVAVQTLAQDHRNDVISNAFGMMTALIGFYFWKYIDPIGGLCISLLLMFNWARTGWGQVKKMTGLGAPPEFLSMLTYIAYSHDKRIRAVDTVRAYHTSDSYIVEVDILLPETMKLKEAHDIGEALQIKLEQLPEVERAFVHLDYEFEHHHHDEHPSLKPPVKKNKDEVEDVSKKDKRG